MTDTEPTIDVVILTMGDRPEALDRAIASVVEQDGAPNRHVTVVWNGAEPTEVDAASLPLSENVGITEGRNQGAAAGDAPVLFFLDDDAEVVTPSLLREAVDILEARPELAVVALRIVDENGDTSHRHVPRLGGGTADRAGDVTAFLGGAVVMRREAFDAVDGYGGELFYAMEETDLSWRLHDAGWSIHYAAHLHVRHPRVDPSRHAIARETTARNRVWIARRNLPAPLLPIYVGGWLLLVVARSVARRERPAGLWKGTRAGWASCPFERRPISWRTVWRLTRLGRPPIV